MASRINPIDHSICLALPESGAPSSWAEHLPFVMWLTSVLRPRLVVALGARRGTTYCGFCQAIDTLNLPSRAFAIDTWNANPQTQSNGPAFLRDLRCHHDSRYGHFSTLLEMSFDEALSRFADSEIDLLHIDGWHSPEALRHTFENWRPKVSSRGVVLFQDVAAQSVRSGVWRLWAHLTKQFPSFTFEHAQDLGMLAVGSDLPADVRALVEMGKEDSRPFRELFEQLGRRVSQQMELDAARAGRDATREELRVAVASWRRQEDRLKQTYGELAELHASFSWRLTQRLSGLAKRIAPARSLRRAVLKASIRLAEVVLLEGTVAAARKVARHARQWLPTSVRIAALRARRLRPKSDGNAEPIRSSRRSEAPVFLLVTHQGGGGTERHVREVALALRSEGIRPILVRPSRRDSILWEERDQGWEVTWCQSTNSERITVESLIGQLAPVHAHIHHVMGLPDGLIGVLNELGVPYDWTIHDYYTICPRVHLNRADGVYCGEPDESACDACLARLGDYNGRSVAEGISRWRDGFTRRLAGTGASLLPARMFVAGWRDIFPDLPIIVRPHFEVLPTLSSLAAPWYPGETVRVAILGEIVHVKGSKVILSCARDARARRLPLEFLIFGSTNRDAALTRLGNVSVTGPYREREVYERLDAQRCHLAFLPSLWPETYMYTLSIAMAARLYVICFDLGAQSERLQAWGWGRALPLETDPATINAELLRAARSVASGPIAPPPPASAHYREFLVDYYDFTVEERDRIRRSAPGRAAGAVPQPHLTAGRVHARFH